MIEGVLQNLIASAIAGVFVWAVKKILNWIKVASVPAESGVKYKRKTVKGQFYFCMVATPILVALGFSASFVWKTVAFICAFFSFVLEWGAFDAALAFYPVDEVVNVPADESAESERKQASR